jgi:hypothetical protein
MIIQAHLAIIIALDVMMGWRDLRAVGKIWCFLSNFSAKNLLINTAINHIRLLLILFIISQWVYQMIIQAHLGIIMALDVMLGYGGISKLLARFGASCPTFQPKTF